MQRSYFLVGVPIALVALAVLAIVGFGGVAAPALTTTNSAADSLQATAVPPSMTTGVSEEGPNPPPAVTRIVPSSRGGSRTSFRVGLQAGHWRENEMPDELASLRSATGAQGSGWREIDVNLDIARRAAGLLEAAGVTVDLLPAAVPENYQADVFLALHGDAGGGPAARGFKVARGGRSAIPEVDDALVNQVYDTYGRMTGLPRDDKNITTNMRDYYAFAGGGISHAVAKTTPAAILEMGFLSNATDRNLLMGSSNLVAQAVAASVLDFLARR